MMQYTSVSSPEWIDAGHMMISVEVVFPAISSSPMKFNASSKDVMDYGRQIYSDLIAGKYGPIAEPTTE